MIIKIVHEIKNSYNFNIDLLNTYIHVMTKVMSK